jgi:hypothetical protein
VVDDPLEPEPEPEPEPERFLLPFFFEEVLIALPPFDPEPDIELPVWPVLVEPDDPVPAPIELPPVMPLPEPPPAVDPPPDVPPDVCANPGAANRAAAAATTTNLFMMPLPMAQDEPSALTLPVYRQFLQVAIDSAFLFAEFIMYAEQSIIHTI